MKGSDVVLRDVQVSGQLELRRVSLDIQVTSTSQRYSVTVVPRGIVESVSDRRRFSS